MDWDTKKNTYGNITTDIPINSYEYDALEKKFGISRTVFFIAVGFLTLSIYNKSENVSVCWVHNGRDTISAQNVIGALLRDLYVGVRFREEMSIEDLFCEVSNQVEKGICYSVYPFRGPECSDANKGDFTVIYQHGLRTIRPSGSLDFTVSGIPTQEDCSENLLDAEILKTEEGCCLYLDYNASAYRKESMQYFSKIFISVACLLAKHEINKNLKVKEMLPKKLGIGKDSDERQVTSDVSSNKKGD